jgi:hypothetical protein
MALAPFTLKDLFLAARFNPRNPMNQPGRLLGTHCKARTQRAQAKRLKSGRKPYDPAGMPPLWMQPSTMRHKSAP